MEELFVNKVANSGLITLNPEDYRPKGIRTFLDIKDWLFHGLILKEKDFRQSVKDHDWSIYQDQYVAIGCTTDAIVPAWAFTLVAISLEPFAKTIFWGSLIEMEKALYRESLDKMDFSIWEGEKIILRGCGAGELWEYVEMASRLRPLVQSLMFGEACSSVPLYKKKAIAVKV